MKRLFLLILLFFALLVPWTMRAQTVVEIGDASTTNYYLPIGTLYNYSITEQLYTSEEIGTAGVIQSISFNYCQTDSKDFPIEVYMKTTDEENLQNAGISLADAELVFEGTLSVTGEGWVTITLDSPFVYDGTSNLLIGINKGYVKWYSNNTWYHTEIANMARYSQNDNTAYTSGTVPGSLSSYRPNIKIEIVESGSICERPSSFDVTNITSFGAVFTWTSQAARCTFEYKEAAATEWTVVEGITSNSYTLNNLQPYTNYSARVKAVCGTDSESGYRTAYFTTPDYCPDGMVCIGEGEAASSYLPANHYYNNSLTEQIYTAEELGSAGAILSIDFYKPNTTAMTVDLDIYMVYTDKDEFESNIDWITVTPSDLVYSGTVTFADNAWTTIELDIPFDYDGSSNVALVVDKSTTYVTSAPFFVFSTDQKHQAIYYQSDTVDPDPTNPAQTGNLLYVKNRIRLTKGAVPTCAKPTFFEVSNVGKRSADLSWTENGDATQWQICLNGNESNLITTYTNPFTLSGLTPETEYTVKVRSFCNASEQSRWSSELSFTTEIACHAPTNLIVSDVMPNSANIRWEGNVNSYSLRYREMSDSEVAIVKLTAGDVWHDGTGYQMLLDADATAYGTIIPSSGPITADGVAGSGNFGDVAASVYEEFEYKIPMDADGSLSTNHIVVNNSVSILIPFGTYDWCITNPTPSDNKMWIAGNNGTMASRYNDYVFEAGKTYEFEVAYYEDENGDGGDGVSLTITDNSKSSDSKTEWITVNNVSSPYHLNSLLPQTAYEVQVQAVCGGQDGESTWVSACFLTPAECSAPWAMAANSIMLHSAVLTWDGYQQSYNLRYHSAEDSSWEVVYGITSPYTLSGLEPDTEYEWQVQGINSNCDGGVTEWCATVSFTTASLCGAPSNLEVVDVTANTATFNWSGAQEYFNLRYRTAEDANTVLSQDFSEGMGDWITVNQHPNTGISNGVFRFRYTNDSTYFPQYLISPMFASAASGTFLEFFYACYSASWPESFMVGYSSTGNSVDDFVWGEEITTDNLNFEVFSQEVPVGTKYFAIKYTAWDKYYLLLDDFLLYDNVVSAGDWVEVTNVTNGYTLTGLTSNTLYDWNLQIAGCDPWYVGESFLTLESIGNNQMLSLMGGTDGNLGNNWVSLYTEITMNDLRAALVSAMPGKIIKIQGQGDNCQYNPNNGRWSGRLSALDFSQMYKILVPDDAVVVLEGDPVNPAAHPATLNPGSNWIAFPLTETMTLNDAFAGFALQGDKVQSQFFNASYNRNRWQGGLASQGLEPGKGYVYENGQSDVRTLSFPASRKSVGNSGAKPYLHSKKSLDVNSIHFDEISERTAKEKKAVIKLSDLPTSNFKTKLKN